MSLMSLLKGKGPSGFGYGSTAEQVTEGLDLSGKTYLVTGCNSGLGLETIRVLSLRGGYIIAAARSEAKAKDALDSYGIEGTPVSCELSEPASVRACVDTVKELGRPLDAIICNAGIMALPKLQQQYGYDMQFFTNHIGHFILVTGLLDELTEEGRVVMLSSSAHQFPYKEGIQFDNLSGETGYSSWKSYGQSKLSNLLFAKALAKRFAGTKQTANAVHPGVIKTNLGRHMGSVSTALMGILGSAFMKNIPQGAATQCYVATNPALSDISGLYFADSNEAKTSKWGQDEELAERLWQVSEEIVAKL